VTIPPRLTTRYRWYALGLLALINLLNYIDRNVIYALFEPIKADLGLTDGQLGWLGSAYILVFSVAALPFGVLSDLRSRRAVEKIGAVLDGVRPHPDGTESVVYAITREGYAGRAAR